MRRWSLAIPLLVSALAGCDPGQGDARARARFNNCAPCHGEGGAGNPQLLAPPIAGLPAWYIEAQLRKFRDGARGFHPEDEAGLRMRPMARTLGGDVDIKALAAFVARQPHVGPADRPLTVQGNTARGKTFYAPCVACHGERGSGNQAVGSPDLIHTADWYMLSQLRKFKDGHRGVHPTDTTGAQMRAMAMTLPDEQAMRDVVAYIMTLEK